MMYEEGEGEAVTSGTVGGKPWGTGIEIGEDMLDFVGDNFLLEKMGGDVDVGG